MTESEMNRRYILMADAAAAPFGRRQCDFVDRYSWWPVAQTNVICKRARARHKTNGWKKESDFGSLIGEK